MYRFHIYSNELLIGWSELELGDPPMGVAFGKFIPSHNYMDIQPTVIALTNRDQSVLSLSARLPDGEKFDCVGVGIADCSCEADGELEVTVLGIDGSLYERLFPHHIAAYARQFPTDV